MSDRFVLTAELQLRAPTNTRDVLRTVQQQLNGVDIPVRVGSVTAGNRALASVERRLDRVSTAAERMGNSFGLSLRRFAAFSIANRAVGLFTNRTSAAIEEAIDFERELIKVAQVTGKTKKELDGLTSTITKLSTTDVGTSSRGLLGTARVLSQAGIEANDLTTALNALAKTTLAPTFDDIEQTAEGAVAVLAQFGEGVGALESQLGAINAVAGQFAVESGDLISAVRRTGGVFKSAGGDLNELLALFTSVRATTRESAESIATGMRTIFTRIQRPQTIEYMKQFGVQLTDLEGKFVGPFEATRQLSEALSSFEEGDIRFVKIAEELGGFRQIGKVLPLIQKFELAEKARQAALAGGNSLTEDTIVAQQSLAVQFTKVREEFLALARSMTETSSFRVMIQSLLSLSSSLIKLSESFRPILPVLGALAAIKITRGIGNFAAGLGSGLARRGEGGPIGFNTGGLVPGQGSGDTVPAMLTPGEFVIKKKSVESLGVGTLQQLNSGGQVQRYANGGVANVRELLDTQTPFKVSEGIGKQTVTRSFREGLQGVRQGTVHPNSLGFPFAGNSLAGSLIKKATAVRDKKSGANSVASGRKKKVDEANQRGAVSFATNPGAIGGFFLNPDQGQDRTLKTNKDRSFDIRSGPLAGREGVLQAGSTLQGFTPSVKDLKKTPSLAKSVEASVSGSIKNAMLSLVPVFDEHVSVGPFNGKEESIKKAALKLSRDSNTVNTTTGFMFEGIIQALTGAQFTGSQSTFDFDEKSLATDRGRLKQLFGSDAISSLVKADAKKRAASGNDIFNKVTADIAKGNMNGVQRLANGGMAREDTVPALLTPGEFVVNRDTAKRVGYANLERLNRDGMQGLNKGGIVGAQKFGDGGPVGGGGFGGKGLVGLLALQAIPGIIQQMTTAADGQATTSSRVAESFGKVVSTASAVVFAMQALGVQLNKENLRRGKDFALGRSRQGVSDSVSSFTSGLSGNLRRRSKLAGFDSVRQGGLGGLLSKGKSSALGSASRLTAGLGPALGKLAAVAGPAAAIGGTLAALNSVFTAYQDNLGKYNDAVEAGNVAKAQELAVAKNVSGLAGISDFTTNLEQGFRELLGGQTRDELELLAKSSALAGKHQSEFAKNAKLAASTLDDIQGKRTSASEAFASGDITKNFASAVKVSEAKRAAADKKLSDRAQSGVASRVARDIFSLGGTLFENSGAKDRRINKESKTLNEEATAVSTKEFEALAPAFRALSEEMAYSKRGLAGFSEAISELGLNADQTKEVTANYKKQNEAIRENIDYISSLNLGLRDVISTAGNTALGLTNLVRDTQVGNNPFISEIENIKAALTNVASEMTSVQIGNVRDSIERALTSNGGSKDQAASTLKTFDLISNVARQSAGAFEQLKQDRLKGTYDTVILNKLGENLAKGKDDKQANIIRAIVRKLDLNTAAIASALENNDFSEVADVIQKDLIGSFGKQILAIQEANKTQENALIQLTKRKIALQNQEVSAIQESVKIRLSAINSFSEFSGNRVSSSARRGLLAEGANASLKKAGVGQLNANTGAGGISALFRQLNKASFDQKSKDLTDVTNRRGSAFGGAQGLDSNRIDEVNRANKDLLQFTKDRIAIVRDELALARKKTELERSSVESLIDGDYLGFLKGEQAVEAANALKSGDASTANQFAPEIIGKALRNVLQQDISLDDKKRAAHIGLREFATERRVNLLVGQTKEEQPFLKEGKELSRVLIEAGKNLVDFADRDIQVTNATIDVKNEIKKENELSKKEQEAKAAKAAKKAAVVDPAPQEKKKSAEEIRKIQERSSRATKFFANSKVSETELARPITDEYTTTKAQQGLYIERQREKELKNAEARRQTPHLGGRFLSQGGTVYASNGMFVPRGTDTVPAMLTPGEFVVNRGAVQRGNNLQLLRAMNGGDGVSYNRGVQYRQSGGAVQSGGGSLSLDYTKMISGLNSSFARFADSVDKLAGTKLQLSLDTTNVNVNLTGTSFLNHMTNQVKDEIMEVVIRKLRSIKHAPNGTHIVD